jgi:anti-anti-sigma factor
MPLEVREQTESLTHVALSGQLTVLGVERLSGPVHHNIIDRKVNAVIDLAEVSFIASAGISLLLTCRKQLGRHGAKVVLLSPTPDVERTLRAARMDKLFPITHSLEDATAALAD